LLQAKFEVTSCGTAGGAVVVVVVATVVLVVVVAAVVLVVVVPAVVLVVVGWAPAETTAPGAARSRRDTERALASTAPAAAHLFGLMFRCMNSPSCTETRTDETPPHSYTCENLPGFAAHTRITIRPDQRTRNRPNTA
jgi:hypothetical protein